MTDSARKRPILLIANNFPPIRGGSAAVYASLADCAGGRVIVIAPRVTYADGLPIIGWREHDRHARYRVIRLALLRNPFGLRNASVLRRLAIRADDAWIRVRLAGLILFMAARHGARTVVIGELIASAWVVFLLGWIPGMRSIAYVHGEEITTVNDYDADHERCRRTLVAADATVVVSRFTQQAVVGLVGPRAAARVTLIENGVDTARFRPAARKPESLIALYGLRDRFVFISICRLLEKKGVDVAIRAFARLAADHPDCRYVIVGTGSYAETLKTIAAETPAADKIVFAGPVAEGELVEHYQSGDVFVMPNRRLPDGDTEGFGLVFLEANACGLPVIAGRDGGSTDAVEDEVNGLVVDGSAEAAVLEAMRRLYTDTALRERIGRTALAVSAAANWQFKTRAFLTVCDAKASPGTD